MNLPNSELHAEQLRKQNKLLIILVIGSVLAAAAIMTSAILLIRNSGNTTASSGLGKTYTEKDARQQAKRFADALNNKQFYDDALLKAFVKPIRQDLLLDLHNSLSPIEIENNVNRADDGTFLISVRQRTNDANPLPGSLILNERLQIVRWNIETVPNNPWTGNDIQDKLTAEGSGGNE